MIGERLRPSTQVKDWVSPGLVDVGEYICWPSLMGNAVTVTAITFDAANEKAAIILQVPKTGIVDRVGFRATTVTVTGTIDVRLETVDSTTGDPTGSLVAANTNASLVLSTAGFKEVTLTAGGAVTKGDWIAIVLVNPAVSPASATLSRHSFPGWVGAYADNYTGSWAKSARAAYGGVLRYSDGTYPAISSVFPFSGSPAANGFGSGSTPDERGNKFTMPFACEVVGFWVAVSSGVDVRSYLLYDAAGNVLASIAVSGTLVSATEPIFHLLPAPVRLTAGQVVRLTTRPDSAATVALTTSGYVSGMESAMPGRGVATYTTRADAGAWTDLSTTFAHMGFIISKVRVG